MTQPSVWPFDDLVVRAGSLELRLPNDAELHELAAVAAAGIHDDDFMPFASPWSRAASPELERNVLQFHWGLRSRMAPEFWHLALGVFIDGIAVGFQDVSAKDFATMRSVSTGSWLGREYQGHGVGTMARAALLEFAFRHLGALDAASGYIEGNAASARVSQKLGYRENGFAFDNVDGEKRREYQVFITSEDWKITRPPELRVSVHGLDACRPLLGSDPAWASAEA